MNHKIILDMFIFEVSYLNVYYLITNNGNINFKIWWRSDKLYYIEKLKFSTKHAYSINMIKILNKLKAIIIFYHFQFELL